MLTTPPALPQDPPKNRAHVLSKLAEERGMTVKQLVITTVESAESITAAAKQLGVTTRAISYHLRKRNLRTRTKVTVEAAP